MSDAEKREQIFLKDVQKQFEQQAPNFNQSLNIAVIGKVSSGKSSLINALLQRTKETVVVEVGAKSGVTTTLMVLKLDERVSLIDSPGLDDVRADNSKVTEDFLKHIDVGIFLITGSSDNSQKQSCDDLRNNCSKTFVVLNKIDEYDKYEEDAETVIEEVIEQWKSDLQVDRIYPVATIGFEPRVKRMDIRGVEKLRSDVDEFLTNNGKDLLLARHMRDKRSKARKIIAVALVAVSGAAFVPGGAAIITAAQATAIVSLVYLYTGKVLSNKQALAMLPGFSQAIGYSVFLWVESFLPPTGILDIAAAVIAFSITLAILASVNDVLYSGEELAQEKLLRSKFERYLETAKHSLREMVFKEMDFKEIIKSTKNPSFWVSIIDKIVGSRIDKYLDSRNLTD